jgi:hypothetical protein
MNNQNFKRQSSAWGVKKLSHQIEDKIFESSTCSRKLHTKLHIEIEQFDNSQ